MPATVQSEKQIQALEKKITALEAILATMQRNVDFVNERAKAYIDRQNKAQDERFKGLESRQSAVEKRDKELQDSMWKKINAYNSKLIAQIEQADSRIAREIIKRNKALDDRIAKLEKLAKKK